MSEYEQVEGVLLTTTDLTVVVQVTCPTGKTVLSGGYEFFNVDPTRIHVERNRPNTATTWFVELDNPDAQNVQVRGFAICAVVS